MKKFNLAMVAVFLILGCLVLTSSSVFAQQVEEGKASIVGNVIRHSSAETGITFVSDRQAAEDFIPAVGIKVTIDGPEARSTFTDQNGEFAFFDLAPGEYMIEVTSPLYLGLRLTNIVLEAGDVFDVKSQMPLGIPLGSTFYLFAGVNRENQAFYADNSSFVMYNVFTQFNAISQKTDLINGEDFSKAAFKSYLEDLGRKTTFSDQVVLFYSGVTFVDPSDGKVYLDCSDAKYIEDQPIYDTLISEDDIVNWLNESFINNPNILVILDAPHAEIIGEALANRLWSTVCIISGAKGEEWYEIIDFGTGAFTISMLSGFVSINESNGLPYADIDGDGKVTINEIVRFTSLFLEVILDGTDLKQEVSVYVNDMEAIDHVIFVLNK